MALPDSVKLVDGTAYIVAHDADWAGTDGWAATVDAELDLTGVTTNTYEQSAKLDLGANRDPYYTVEMMIEMDTDPTDGDSIDVYVGYSSSATAATDNPAGLSGSSGAYTGYDAGAPASEAVKHLEFVGSLVLTNLNDVDDKPQKGLIGIIVPKKRYVMFCVHNNSAVSGPPDAGGDKTAIQVTGITHQVQD